MIGVSLRLRAKTRRAAVEESPSSGVEGLRSLYPEEEETKTPITRISQKHADSPSTGIVATLARPSLPAEGFCGIGVIGSIGVRSSQAVLVRE